MVARLVKLTGYGGVRHVRVSLALVRALMERSTQD